MPSTNISKIRTSLALLKDGQSVFTNLEKCYVYRYAFAKGISASPDICEWKLLNISKML